MARLRDLGEWSGGNTPSKANTAYWTDGTIPWVSPKDMKIDEITSSEDRVSEAALKEGRVSLVPEGSVLVVTRSGILSHTLPVAVTKAPVTINQDLKALIPKPGILPRYVAHALRGASRRILKECSKHGTTVASVETNALLDFEIPLVDVDEQRRIVAELEKQFSRLDRAVANLTRVKANLARQKLAVFDSATTGKLLARSSDAVDDSKTGGRHADLPSGWRWIEIGELADVVRGGSPRPAGDPRYFGGPIPWITVGPITADDEDYLRSVPTGLTEAGRERSRYIEPHTLLLTNSGATLGVPKISLIGGCINDGVAALLNVDYPLKKYLLIYLRSKTAEMRRVNQGAAQPNLNTTIIKRYRVPVPPMDEQHRIVAEVDRRLSIVREVDAEVEANLQRAQALRQAVLTHLLASTN
jgi:type I restriction enzyme S subunit